VAGLAPLRSAASSEAAAAPAPASKKGRVPGQRRSGTNRTVAS